ncbi:DNA integrity scanning protein DisA nucleotide-binding domain protein [Fusibacter ferrireducens]|uniref:DNA integrity scanning protein DisA nucleotide-binding domain protein n=1 Tax=Fusibacter ferrireducens TaxID=2785058 RepID=A0ABR9ZUK9_9FIRM|nr:DNA integrity scanning protein DisA nucleotide-binding domain protein [Fusibacter ferrireducens]MBF4694130.1 DNA integrity scanning protein DisA nucleotide-binding domain protein [Fusibacter ferrireducens]
MLIKTVHELSELLDQFSQALFKRIDNELVPSFYLVLFDISNEHINMSFSDDMVSIPTEVESIEHLNQRKEFLKDLMALHISKAFSDATTIFYSDFFVYNNSIFTYAFKFDRKILDSYYKITDDSSVQITSIIDAIIFEAIKYIDQCAVNFIESREITQKSIKDLLKDAGKALLGSIFEDESFPNPFDKFSKISSLSYEKAFSNGKILLFKPNFIESIIDSSHIKLLLTFEERIPLSSFRHIRKILELSKKDIYLLSDGEYIYSVIQFTEESYHLDKTRHYFIVEFNTYYSWQLNHNNNKLMQVTNEEVYIPKPKISYFNFSAEFKKVFPEVETKKILNLYKLVLEALKQVKGTILVISKNARSEAYRLRNQGFIINATFLNVSTIKSITSIDGAVLVDVEGFCHGIGVILDGVATEKGDPSRGARYNSAIRYVETIAHNQQYSDCLTVVISEDGDVDIISKYALEYNI